MIITIARKYGSGGREIGQRLAKHLNIPYYNVDALPHTRIEDWQEEILRLADAGPCVMVGFCADHVLAGREGLMRTFIHCDMEHRLQRIMEENFNLLAQRSDCKQQSVGNSRHCGIAGSVCGAECHAQAQRSVK